MQGPALDTIKPDAVALAMDRCSHNVIPVVASTVMRRKSFSHFGCCSRIGM